MKEREFKHVPCGTTYMARDDCYNQLTDPLHGQHMYCETCDSAMSTKELIWTDTGENIRQFLRERKKRCKPIVRVLTNGWFLILAAITAFALTLALSLSLFPYGIDFVIGMFLGGFAALIAPRIACSVALKLNDVTFE